MKSQNVLEQFNSGLHRLRELFYKTGRLDDSNTKLDEIVKLLCVEVAAAHEPGAGVPTLGAMLECDASSIVRKVNLALEKVACLDVFRNTDGESLLGEQPRLRLSDSESELAVRMAQLVSDTFSIHLHSAQNSKAFEVLNEAFGHFVRDNFRNNIEDAQYMTPPEVVDFMCEIGMAEARRVVAHSGSSKFVVVDPSCGVGSFLAQFYRYWLHNDMGDSGRLVLLGQDKVDRMARLAKLNLLLFRAPQAIIARGNSLLPGSQLDAYVDSCDLILTNPPFGARFHSSELGFHSSQFFPSLHNVIQTSSVHIDSELLFLDRYISLLRPGGAALVVLPDAVVSAKGLPELVRDHLAKKCSIVSVTELPAVAFAQAGTRTRTCILHFRKNRPTARARVFFACASELGFEVASRKGVPYKRYSGHNELPLIVQAYREREKTTTVAETTIHQVSPSCVSVPYESLRSQGWTPSHHSASRYLVLSSLDEKSSGGALELVRLGDMVILPNQFARSAKPLEGTKCISVLHVGEFGSLDVKGLMTYSPKYPGQPCRPGDILFSKINPRIPRALVVPDLGMPLSCSSEFEVMQAQEPYSPYEIMMLLLSSYAQAQIHSLTSGTSSSHNRIKTEQLLAIRIPIPKARPKRHTPYARIVADFARAHRSLVEESRELHAASIRLDALLTG